MPTRRASFIRLLNRWDNFVRKYWLRIEPISQFDQNYPLVLILSTGRVGTQTLAELLRLAPNLKAYHEPEPKLFGLGKLAYEQWKKSGATSVFLEALRTSRADLIKDALQYGKGYAETSPQVTFLAPVFRELFPMTKYIHLVRNPENVIISGMRRGWYSGHSNDQWRLTPKTEDKYAQIWGSMSPFAKNCWVWAETNRWISDFCRTIPRNQQLFVNSELLFAGQEDIIRELFEFVGVSSFSMRKVNGILRKPLNVQKKGTFSPSNEWSIEMKATFGEIVGDVADEFDYLKR